MPFCANCGAQVEGRFCAKCGAAVGAAAPPPTGAVPPPPPPPPLYQGAVPPPAAPGAAGLTENVASMLCYVLGFITGIIFLVLEPYNKNRTVRFHAFQSIFLSVAAIIIRWVLTILLLSLHLFDFWALSSLVSLAFLALWIYMLVATYQGKQVVLPVIGPLAQKQA